VEDGRWMTDDARDVIQLRQKGTTNRNEKTKIETERNVLSFFFLPFHFLLTFAVFFFTGKARKSNCINS
jgi:hypothetical protein